MKKLPDKKIQSLIEVAYELRDREFKSAFSWVDPKSSWLREKVARAVLGMTNIKYGGNIILGIKEDTNGENKKMVLERLTEDQLESFGDYDAIKGFIDGFSYLDTNFDMGWGKYEKKRYVVLTVAEFYKIPMICKKDGQHKGVLRKDDIYVRSRKGPYSTIRTTELELREIIKMAADKERVELRGRGYVKTGKLTTEQFYKQQIKDLE